MPDPGQEFLLRVKPLTSGGYSASCRQFAGASHPDVRCVIGVVARGEGQTELAAMIAALTDMRLGQVREVPSHGRG